MATVKREVIVCDICGEDADGEYNATGWVNGEVSWETSCPHDLCQTHMREWSLLCEEQAVERYDASPSDAARTKLLETFKHALETSSR